VIGALGWYCVVDGFVTLTDANEKPISPKRHLGADGDARLLGLG
jgi:hypothetical protein